MRFNTDIESKFIFIHEHQRERETNVFWACSDIQLSPRDLFFLPLAFFEFFDLILAMDKTNLSDLHEHCPPHCRHKLGLFLSRSQSGLEEVPDPYWSGSSGFELVLDLAEEVCGALIDEFVD